MSTLALVIACLALFLMLLSLSLYFYYNKRIRNGNTRLIKGQREMLENRVYEANKPLVSDPVFMDDTSRILFDPSNPEMVGVSRVPDFSFFKNMDINLTDITVEDHTVAVLMPFNSRFDRVYNTIKEACQEEGYKCHRSDEELVKDNTLLRRYIVEMILKARVLVAVLDGRNPNVYYEIGIAHAMGKLVLLIANVNNSLDIPVNFKANRLILYSNPAELKSLLRKTLKAVHHD